MSAIKLESRLDLAAAEALRSTLLEALAASATATLDGSAVESIDTACLQVLAAYAREAAEARRPLAWAGVSPALAGHARRLGLGNLLALDNVTT
jgi:anti-anti-sigma regulatory factor